jgi:hypothetical protein
LQIIEGTLQQILTVLQMAVVIWSTIATDISTLEIQATYTLIQGVYDTYPLIIRLINVLLHFSVNNDIYSAIPNCNGNLECLSDIKNRWYALSGSEGIVLIEFKFCVINRIGINYIIWQTLDSF